MKQTDYLVVASGAAGYWIQITYPELRKVETLLNIQFDTDPVTWLETAVVQDKAYDENVVGISLYVNPTAGTTLSIESVAIGF